MGPEAAISPDGKRLHLQHGPIDLIIGAEGHVDDRRTGFRAAKARFETVLCELVEELPELRRRLSQGGSLSGSVARRMAEAVRPHADVFVTPMAAVAGSVADEICAVMCQAAPGLRRIWVNNGGDIALHLAAAEVFDVGIVPDPRNGRQTGSLSITSTDPVRGIATSGRHGRSVSLGIADAVTVLADTAAAADVAATLIANAVDLPGHPAVQRVPACEIDPDSDLGPRPVTTDVGALSGLDISEALARGEAVAENMRSSGLIHASVLCLSGKSIVASASPFPSSDQVREIKIGFIPGHLESSNAARPRGLS